MTRSWWRAYLAANLAVTGGYFLLPRFSAAQAWLYVACFAGALVALLAAVRANRPVGAMAWWMLAAAQALSVAAGVVWYLYPALTGAVLPFPSVADALYLSAHAVYVGVLGLLARRRGGERDGVELLDSAIITVGAGVLSWVFLIAPSLRDSDLPLLARGVSTAYPLLDVLLLAMAARLAIGTRMQTPALWLLLAWSTGQLLGDSGYSLTVLHGSFHYGHPLFAGWLVAYGFLGAAALHPSMRTLATPQPERGHGQRGRLVALAAAGLLAPGVLIVDGIQAHQANSVVIALAAALLMILVLVRLGRLIGVIGHAEAQLTRSQAQLVEAQRIAKVGSFELDLTSGRQTGSAEMYRIFGLEPSLELAAETVMALIHPDDRPGVQALLARVAHDPAPYELRVRIVRPDGAVRTLLSRGEGIVDGSGRVVRLVGSNQDVTDRQHVQEQAARLASIVECSHDAIFIETMDGTVVAWNAGAERLLGYPADDIIGQSRTRLLPPGIPDDWPRWQQQLSRGQAIEDHETVRLRRDGQHIPVALTISPIHGEDGTVTGASSIVRDITQRKRLEDQLTHQALHDPLTGLPNRTLLHDRTDQAIRQVDRELVPAALLLIDLDHFKEVNDTLGHHNGDQLLVHVSQRLQAALREVDTVARLGGDEFGVLLPRTPTAEGAMAVAGKLRTALAEPFTLNGVSFDVEASIGVALYPGHGNDADELLQHADIAMYAAKETHAGFVLFDPTLDQHSPRKLALLGQLRRAIDDEQLLLHYQPKVDAHTGQVLGVEALVRWQHPEHGLIPPDDFIPLAERTGLIAPLTHYVLDAGLRQCHQWRQAGIELSMAVNVSARRLLDLGFPDEVADLLAAWQIPPPSLVLELTESAIMADPPRALEILGRLNTMGVQLSIDDFGTGYSSMAYLKRLPVDELKIDQSFVIHLTTDHRDALIVRSTIDLGRNLGLRVVAEGVEDSLTLQRLDALGCDAVQGYYISRPVPADDLIRWLQQHQAATAILQPRR